MAAMAEPVPDSPDSVVIRVSDSTLDRLGTIIRADGYVLDNYRKNPVVLNGHNVEDIMGVIGRAKRTWVEGDSLMQEWQFAVHANPVARIAYHLYAGGFCRAASVRCIPLEWIDGRPKDGFVRMLIRQELTEVSACGVPLNPNALVRALKDSGAPPSVVDVARALPPLPSERERLISSPEGGLRSLAREFSDAAQKMGIGL